MHFSGRLRVVLVFLVLADVACTKAPPPAEKPLSLSESLTLPQHATAAQSAASQVVLQKTFELQKSATFPFEIPAHQIRPHLHGIFESFAGKMHGASDESADIDFLLLNEEQNAAVAANRATDAVLSVAASPPQAVNFDLPASMSERVRYYLVFRNSEKNKGKKVVVADFRVDF